MNAIVEKAELSRRAAFKTRVTPDNSINADPPKAATFPAQELLPDVRIPEKYLSADLDYLVPKPLIEHDDDAFQPQIRKKGNVDWMYILKEDEFIEPGPVADRDWTVPYQIPNCFLIEETTPEAPTEWEFRYIFFAGGGNDAGSDISTFGIDRTPPYKVKDPLSDRTPGAPTWPADLSPAVPIDETYLEGKTGILVKPLIPANYETTDVYRFYFGPAPDPGRDTPVYENSLSAAREAEIPVAVFRGAADGPNQLIYVSTDLTGNKGRQSTPSLRTVAHAKDPDPITVKPPVVTLANGTDGDDLIDLADTQVDPLGVEFKVTVPTPNANSDTIVGYWGDQPVGAEQRVGNETELTFYAPYSLVKQVYGETDGIVVTNVSWKMFRGANRELAKSDIDIDVDISFIGPDPITIGLEPPRLTTTKGNTDEIKEEDFDDTGITVHIDIFDAPATEEGWFIKWFYDDMEIGLPIPLTTGQEGTTIDRILPWATVEAQRSGTKVLRYMLYTPAGRNPTQSRTKDIPVEEFPIEMVAPQVIKLSGPRRRIGCATLNFPTATIPSDGTERRNMLVRILPNQYTVDGETITLKYEAFTMADPPVAIPNTDAEATYPIIGAFPADGVIIEIGDYDEDFKPAHAANGKLTYSISRGGAGNNPTPESLPAIHQLDLVYSQGQYCEEYVPTP